SGQKPTQPVKTLSSSEWESYVRKRALGRLTHETSNCHNGGVFCPKFWSAWIVARSWRSWPPIRLLHASAADGRNGERKSVSSSVSRRRRRAPSTWQRGCILIESNVASRKPCRNGDAPRTNSRRLLTGSPAPSVKRRGRRAVIPCPESYPTWRPAESQICLICAAPISSSTMQARL